MNYLLEIGTEELPARLVEDLCRELHQGLVERLLHASLPCSEGSRAWGTPRRIAVLLEGLPPGQEDRVEEVTGPPAHVAFDDEGNPTKAAEGFARKHDAPASDLRRVETDKGEYAVLEVKIEGRTTAKVLAEAVPAAMDSLHLAVSMKWGRGKGPFVRAVRWVVSLLDDEVLPLELFGVTAGRTTRGHRVLGPGTHEIPTPDRYAAVLRVAGVEPDPEERRRSILEGLEGLGQEAGAPEGQEFPDRLVDELVQLTEHPVAVRGGFDPEFLEVPREILDTSMRYHQKMFSLRGEDGALLPAFLTVLNNEDPEGTITRGQRQVLEARLHDARFFWTRDTHRGLESLAEDLPRVTFQEALGSYADKVARMKEMAGALQEPLGFSEEEREKLDRAIGWCKADLCSLTVGEFPELQGVVGALMARDGGEPPEVRCPIRFQYAPFDYPRQDDTVRWVHALALLDQTDTLMGCHGAGLEATGSKDPYGLRRAGLLVARLLTDGRLGGSLELKPLLNASRRAFRKVEGYNGDDATEKTRELLESRLRHHLREERQFPYDEINAVFASGWERPDEARARLEALHAVRESGRLDGLAEPLKRVRNILRDADAGSRTQAPTLDPDALTEAPARALHEAARKARAAVETSLDQGDIRGALEELAGLREPVDRFFEEVLVMDEDPAVRANRLALLRELRGLFLRVADLGEIVESAPEAREKS